MSSYFYMAFIIAIGPSSVDRHCLWYSKTQHFVWMLEFKYFKWGIFNTGLMDFTAFMIIVKHLNSLEMYIKDFSTNIDFTDITFTES